MSEPGPVLSPNRPPEPAAYRPVSGLAIASMIVAATYAAVILTLVVVAFATHSPLFLASWTFLLPVAAVGLAVGARQQIRHAEGTRTGTALATGALWLGLLAGLGYGAFYFGTYLAVVRFEAQRFTNDWFDKLQQGQIEQAFLLTRPPEERASNNDQASIRRRFGSGRGTGGGELGRFQDNQVVWVMRRGGPETTVTPLGVRSWDYTEGGYEVVESYRITTPEGTFEVALTVRSKQGREFKGRQWHLVWNNAPGFVQKQLTPRGAAIETWPQLAGPFIQQWVSLYNPERGASEGNSGLFRKAYFETYEPGARAQLRQQVRLCSAVAGFTAPAAAAAIGPPAVLARVVAAVDHDLGQEMGLRSLPGAKGRLGYQDFLAGGLIHWDPAQLLAADSRLKKAIPEAVRRAFRDPRALMMRTPYGAFPRLGPEVANDRLQVLMAVEMRVMDHAPGGERVAKYECKGALLLESDPGPITTERTPRWRVVQLELLEGKALDGGQEQKGPRGPGR